MSTIDDLACAKLAAAGCENPKAVLRDLKLFGPPEKDLSQYLRAKAWELEEAAALGLGRHPRNLSLSVIREKCPEQIDLQCKAKPEDLSPTAQLFIDRYELLKRAAFVGDVKSEERGGTLWFKPVDLATWASKEWDLMPPAARSLMAATGLDVDTNREEAIAPAATPEAGGATFAPASTNAPADGAVGAQEGHSSFFGVSEGEKGESAAWDFIKSETRKPLDERQFKTRMALKDHCKGLGAGWQAFERLYKEAKKIPGFIPFKRGKPSNSK